ncbi:MAG TPA: FAD:protein FMN transferase [Sphingomicrobium sp.]
MLRRCRPLLGTFVEVTAGREEAIDAAFAAIARVHRLMSAHEPDSDVSRINRFAHIDPIRVDPWTAMLIERALFWSRCSEGAFDLVRAGKAAIECGMLPRHADQSPPLASHWTLLEAQGSSVRMLKPGCIDVGGIAKGFAVDRAVDAMRQAGCARGLVNAGGDVRGFGSEPWQIQVVHPLTRVPIGLVELGDCALATSAGLRTGEGLSFDHLDGEELRWVSVSVHARTACDADALTKIVWKSGDRAAALLEQVDASAFGIGRNSRIEPIGEPETVPA